MITIDQDNQEHLYMWGKLGVGDTSMNRHLNASFVPLEIPLPQVGTIKEISLGQHFSSMILTNEQNNDHFYTWGDNDGGQLGLGDFHGEGVNKLEEVFLPVNV